MHKPKQMLTIALDPEVYHKFKLYCAAKDLYIGATIDSLIRDLLLTEEVKQMKASVPDEK